jgi:hypothetical protein
VRDLTNRPLHEAVRPSGSRDDAGALGEALHALADVLECLPAGDQEVLDNPYAIWIVVDNLVKTFAAEESFRHNHYQALSRLEELAKVKS